MNRTTMRAGLLGAGSLMLALAFVPGRATANRAFDEVGPAVITPTELPTPTSFVPTATPPVVTPTTPVVTPTDVAPPPVPPTAVPPEGTPLPPREAQNEPDRTDLRLIMRANKTQARVGDLIEYEVIVINAGPDPARDVVVADSLPPFLALYKATAHAGVISTENNIVFIKYGTVRENRVVMVRVTVQVVSTPTAPLDRNMALVVTSTDGDDPSNNVADAYVEITVAGATTLNTSSIRTGDATARVAQAAPAQVAASLDAVRAAAQALAVPAAAPPAHVVTALPDTSAPLSSGSLLSLLFGVALIGVGLATRRGPRR